MPRSNKIYVHEKALAHLSRGLYRSPASALRELVSNAWDANARVVRIATNYPHFLQVSIEDNGDGFSKDEFKRLMAGNIGNSDKRPRNLTLINNRPVIGRLGIGMLGIAQICGSFRIMSSPKDGEPFAARVRLYDLMKERLDADDPEIVQSKQTGDQIDNQQFPITEIDVGEYTLEPYEPFTENKSGTRIIADDVHPTFSQSFRESLNAEGFEEPPLIWRKAVDVMAHVHSLQQLGDYWKLLWELSAACPIPYVSTDALPKALIKADDKRLQEYDFKVLVDSLELAKPIYLKGNPGGYTTFPIEEQERMIYGRKLRFHGYLAVQEGRQIKPDELRGIMIRIKNVAIGYYDPSMLDYKFNEGPRSRWLTGEIYIDEGLEDALNVDRDSFNRFHPQFRAVQQHIHKVLRGNVFPEVYQKIDERSVAKRDARSEARLSAFKEILAEATDGKVEIEPAEANVEFPILKRTGRKLKVQLPSEEALDTRKSQKQIAAAILTLYELSMLEKSSEAKRRRFSELLLRLFRSW